MKYVIGLALVLMLSGCASFGKKNPKVIDVPMICPAGAIADLKKYELKELTSKDDAEFHAWAATMAGKYPQLKNSYELLYNCAVRRHPELINKKK